MDLLARARGSDSGSNQVRLSADAQRRLGLSEVPAMTVAPLAPKPSWRAAGLRYYKYSHFLAQRFDERVHRISLDGGCTCPNVDGTLNTSGCIFCDNRSFSPARRLPTLPIAQQIDRGIEMIQRRHRVQAFLAYFQPATNTYGDLDRLRTLYEEALAHPRVIGLVVGTRADCVPAEVLDLLETCTRKGFVGVEYGLQSTHQKSLDWLNRAHDVDCFYDAVRRTRGRGIDITAQIILGIPGETRSEMLATADALADVGIDGIKIHNLYVVGHTPLEEQYRLAQVKILDRDEYLDLLVEFLSHLPASTVVHRVLGNAPREYLVAPLWTQRKAEFLQALDRELIRRNAYQGQCCSSP